MNIVSFDDHVADVDADAKFNPDVLRTVGVATAQRPLDVERIAHGVHRAGKLDQNAVARGLHDTTAIGRNPGVDQFGKQASKARARALFIGFDQARVSDDVSRQDRRQSSLGAQFRHESDFP